MTLIQVGILLVTGLFSGFAGGLLGLGGAFIMTPVQLIVFTQMGVPADTAVKLAFGTSLLVVLPTAASGAWRHYRKGAVWWRAALIMGGAGLVFGLLGATLATHLPGDVLKIAFGAVVLLSALRMVTSRQARATSATVTNPWLWFVWAIPSGLVSGILGVGGGVLAIPIMVLALRFQMHRAIATSLGAMILTSAGGVVGYVINGFGAPGLPAYSIGYIYLPAWLLLAVSSIGMAQVGALVAHRLPAGQLKYIFIAVMLYMGLRMLGVFSSLGLPL